MEAAEAHSQANGYRFNVDKCQTVGISEPEAAPTLYAAPIPNGPSFKYLGMQTGVKGIDSTSHYAALKSEVRGPLCRLHGPDPAHQARRLQDLCAPLLKDTKRGLDRLEAIQSSACRLNLDVPKSASRLAMEGPLALGPVASRALITSSKSQALKRSPIKLQAPSSPRF